MEIIVGFAILVIIFAVFPRTAVRFAVIGVGGTALLVLISFLAQVHW